MHNFLLLIFFFFFTFLGHAQKEDHHWIIGRDYNPSVIDTIFGQTSFDFNHDPVRVYFDSIHKTNFHDANSSLCDASGTLVTYTNGQLLMNGMGTYIEDTINYSHELEFYCNDWEYNNYGNAQTPLTAGLLGGQRIILLPMKDKYYAVYNTYDRCKELKYKLSYSEFVVNANFPQGKVLFRDKLVILDTLASDTQAVRHGNGRDWWLVQFSYDYNWLYTFLVNEDGISFHSKVRTVVGKRPASAGQICFSPDGTYLAFHYGAEWSVTGQEVVVYDFDRCSGVIENPRSKILSYDEMAIGNGVAFSHDSRYLYVSTGVFIRQYDMKAESWEQSETIIAEFDGFAFTRPNNPVLYTVNFHNMKLGPDGNIYIFPTSAMQRYLSVMYNPHMQAGDVFVAQHSIYTPRIFSRTVPNMPHFTLGPLDGSPCDTLGMDNHPVAKFRYEADTLDHLQLRFTDLSYFRPETWNWDFGDGSPHSEERYPVHRYDKNGTYEVCLTVSNENSVNTVCRIVTIGGTGTSDGYDFKTDQISLYPNPVSDRLLITLSEYIPEKGMVSIVDITGKTVLSARLYYGQNTLDLTRLSPGMYFCVMTDGGRLMKTEKVVVE